MNNLIRIPGGISFIKDIHLLHCKSRDQNRDNCCHSSIHALKHKPQAVKNAFGCDAQKV
jgi:hypothetical protein